MWAFHLSVLLRIHFHLLQPVFWKRTSKKIVSVMSPQQSERKPSTTGALKTRMTMTEKILARASEKTQLSPGENVWVDVDVFMTHDVCGPAAFAVFKNEFGENAKGWDREKIAVIPDHYIFTRDERANRNVNVLRDYCMQQDIKPIQIIKVCAMWLLHKKAISDLERFCWEQTPTRELREHLVNSLLELELLMLVLCLALESFCLRFLQL